MSSKLLESLSVAVEHEINNNQLDYESRIALGRVVEELTNLEQMGLPAFTTAPTPGNCPACGQKLKQE